MKATATETLLRHDRLIAVLGLAGLTVLAWGFLLSGAGMGMDPWSISGWMPPENPAGMRHAMMWSPGHWLMVAIMWWIMMIGMMVPSAVPMILLYARVSRHAQKNGRMEIAGIPTAAFAGGYLAGWLGFSIGATALQWTLEQTGLINPMTMGSASAWLSGAFLIVAGAYQLSPIKQVCLEHCRSPADYLSRHWRKGRLGAARMGARHGLYCIGCCWFLMALLFVGGVMNLYWILGLAILVLAEKLLAVGVWIARSIGVLLVFSGCAVLII